MPWQRRGEFSRLIEDLRVAHGYPFEFKWEKVGPRYLAFYRDLVSAFFQRTWLSFQCLVVEKKIVREPDLDLARRKHFTKLLTNKIERCLAVHPGPKQTFRIWVDPIHSSYAKADEAVETISNNVLAKALGTRRPVDSVLTHDSRDTPSIMLCDVLLGAVMASWQGRVESSAKLELMHWIAEHLGWEDLRADTWKTERKFNVWFFHDPTRGPRVAVTKPVRLEYPLPERVHSVPPGRT
jgi:hypothetical protein